MVGQAQRVGYARERASIANLGGREPWPVTVWICSGCSTRHTDPPERETKRAPRCSTSFARRQNCTVSPSPAPNAARASCRGCPLSCPGGRRGPVSAVCGPPILFGATRTVPTWLILSELQMAQCLVEVASTETGSKLELSRDCECLSVRVKACNAMPRLTWVSASRGCSAIARRRLQVHRPLFADPAAHPLVDVRLRIAGCNAIARLELSSASCT